MLSGRDIVIIGASTAGLACALALAGYGYTITIYERSPRHLAQARAEVLQPNGLTALQQLGVLDELRACDVVITRTGKILNIDGQVLSQVDMHWLDYPLNYTINCFPVLLQQVLLAKLATFPNVEIVYNAQLAGLLRTDKLVTGVRIAMGGQTESIATRIVIGADGARSVVRNELGLIAHVSPQNETYLLALLPRPFEMADENLFYMVPGASMSIMPVTGTLMQIYYMIRPEKLEQVKAAGIAALRRYWMELAPFARNELKTIRSWDAIRIVTPWRVWAPRWVAHGAALLGDAVHTLSPLTGQGTNIALGDALALAEVVDDCFKRNDFSLWSLLRYQQERKLWAEVALQLSDERSAQSAESNPLMLWLAQYSTQRLGSVQPGLRDRMMRIGAGLSDRPLSWLEQAEALGLLPGGLAKYLNQARKTADK